MFVIPESFPWTPPWLKIPDDYVALSSDDLFSAEPDEATTDTPHKILIDELHREMPKGHVLYGLAIEVVAVCTVTHKDFVYVTNDPEKPLVIVHLTWSQETDPIWPRTQVFTSLHELEAELRKWADDDFWCWPGSS